MSLRAKRSNPCWHRSLLATGMGEHCNRIAGLHPSPICGEGGRPKGRSGGGLSVQRIVTSPPPRPQLRCGRPFPLKGEGQERATSPRKRKIVCRQSRRCPSFETRTMCAPQDGVMTDEVVTSDVNSDPHGEEAHRAVSNHVARLLFENSS